jgi:serine/threonine-protein kinase
MFVCPECGASQPAAGPCAADGWPRAPAGDDAVLGTAIGAYRVARLLGVGGMGRVYKAVQPQIGSRVAIKVLSRECAERRDLVERFFSEARAVNLIRHESIVNVLDLASLPDGRPYIIMEYLDGAPLSAAIDGVAHGGPLPLGSVARLAVEVLDALGAAHAKGIVHRDLKPDNLFVTPAGRPKILDFGIAKLQPELGGRSTRTGALLGTPHYMAPEQAAGRAIDPRTDLYAIGVILFECATGTKPVLGDSLFDVLRKQVDAPPPRPSALRPDLPPPLEQVILAALAKPPEQRWQSAQAMSLALQQATAQLPPPQWAPLPIGAAARPVATPSGPAWGSGPGPWQATPATPAARSFAPAPGPMPAPATGYPASLPGAHPTTVSGQASAPRARSPRPWIALGTLLIAGGITAGVIAGRGPGATPAAPTVPMVPGPAGIPMPPMPPMPARPVKPAMPNVRNMLPTHAPTSLGPGQWFAFHLLPAPNWDPRHVDVDEFIAMAVQSAKQTVSDAELVRIDVTNVYPDGHADLTLSHATLMLMFMSPSRARRDPSVPIGAQPDWHCMFLVMAAEDTGPSMAPSNGTSCDDVRPQRVPRCTMRDLWRKMIDHKAPSGNVVAQLDYFASSSSSKKAEPAQWYARIGDAFHQDLPDTCP